MTHLPPCQAASELRRLTDAALSAVAPDGAVLRHLHLDGGKLTLIDESGAPAWSGGLDAYRRIRNTCRYLLGNLKDVAKADLVDVKDMDPLDRYALDVAARTHQRVQDAYRDYEFHKVFHSLHNLCSTDLSAFYLDILKDRLYSSAPASRQPRAASLQPSAVRRSQSGLQRAGWRDARCQWACPAAMGATTASVSATRSVPRSSISQPRRPALHRTVGCSSTEASTTVGSRRFCPSGETPPTT